MSSYQLTTDWGITPKHGHRVKEDTLAAKIVNNFIPTVIDRVIDVSYSVFYLRIKASLVRQVV